MEFPDDAERESTEEVAELYELLDLIPLPATETDSCPDLGDCGDFELNFDDVGDSNATNDILVRAEKVLDTKPIKEGSGKQLIQIDLIRKEDWLAWTPDNQLEMVHYYHTFLEKYPDDLLAWNLVVMEVANPRGLKWTEDETTALKASALRHTIYGKIQWSDVATDLHPRTWSQCKARCAWLKKNNIWN